MKKKKILIVDDEPDSLTLLGFELRQKGYRTITARDGKEGLRKARQEKPDLILLDVMMPGIDGYEVCRLLKKNSTTKKMPVIMLTVLRDEKSLEQGLGGGAQCFISKPYNPSDLFTEIDSSIKKHKKKKHT